MSAWAIVREARARAGLSQRELAARAGTAQSVVARIERGRQDPSYGLLERLVGACGLDLSVRLVPHDEQTERLIEETLARSPEERFAAIEQVTELAAALRAGGR